MANYPDRCQHLKINGTQCGSPALRRNRFCFFHKRFQDERIRLSADRARRGIATFILPVLEDANSIQIALMQVMRLLLSQQIDHKTASLMLYALQTASTNLRMTTFKPDTNDVILDPRDAVNTPLDSHIWEDDDFEEEEEEDDGYEVAVAARAAAEAKVRELEREIRLRDYVAEHPDSELYRLNGWLGVRQATSPPIPKKAAATERKAEIRAEVSDMVRKELTALDEKFGPAKQLAATKPPEKKAT